MKLWERVLVLALLAVLVSCDGQQKQKQQQQQQITDNASSAASSDGSGKSAAAAGSSGANDRPQYNKRGAPEIQTIVGTPQHAYINQPVVAGGAAAAGLATGTPSISAVAPAAAVAYATYAHPQHQHQQQLVQASSISSPQTIYHKINYVAPGSTLKVATYAAAAPAHYEYAAAAVPGLTKYQYAAAAAYPQYQYAAYPQQHQIQHQQQHQQQQQQPQYQVYQHHQTVQLPAASAIISTAPHPHQTVATLPGHHQLQPGTTIYAAHQPAAFHYTLTQPTQHQQQHNYQQQQSAGHAGTFTYHQAVPVIHQAPIAAIGGQLHHHQQQQVQVAANQYPVVPTAAAPLYATASTAPNQFYHQPTNYAAYPVPLAAKQIVSTVPAPTIATPAHHHQHHLKQLIPVTTATTTHHHGKGISYATFTQQANPASLAHLQQHYLQQQQHQQQQQQQQQQHQQPRYQVYSTVATPLQQKPTLVYGPAGQSSIPAAIYATAPTHLQQLAAFHQHQQQQHQQQQQQHQQQSAAVHYGTHLFQQQQPAYVAPLAKINYGQVQVAAAAAALQKSGGFYHQVQ